MDRYLRELGRTWHQPAMFITLVRLVGSVALWPFLLAGAEPLIVAAAFIIIAATDAVDGHIARKRGQVSDLGKLLDPAVDKLLIGGGLATLAWAHHVLLPVLAIVVIREVAVTILRTRAAMHGRVVAAQWSGKLKMVVQTAAVAGCIVAYGSLLSWGLIVGMVVLTVYSAVEYLRTPQLRTKENV